MEMEALASPLMDAAEAWPATSRKGPVISWKGLWEALLRDQALGVETGLIAARFHRTLIEIISREAIGLTNENGVGTVALSGGAFQHRLLLKGVLAELTGLEGLAQVSVPANDGGLALGQATIGLALSHLDQIVEEKISASSK